MSCIMVSYIAPCLFWFIWQKHNFEIKCLDVNWGETPRNALDDKLDKNIIDCLLPEPKMDSQPDIYVDIRIPNEFQQIGKFNIGITAGVETTAVSGKWIESCNKMDYIYHIPLSSTNV